MNRNQMQNYILQYASFLDIQNKRDIFQIIQINNQESSILNSRRKDVDIDLDIVNDITINQIYDIVKNRIEYLNKPSIY
jgi:Cdc6-like AAA superfamily ATPase